MCRLCVVRINRFRTGSVQPLERHRKKESRMMGADSILLDLESFSKVLSAKTSVAVKYFTATTCASFVRRAPASKQAAYASSFHPSRQALLASCLLISMAPGHMGCEDTDSRLMNYGHWFGAWGGCCGLGYPSHSLHSDMIFIYQQGSIELTKDRHG